MYDKESILNLLLNTFNIVYALPIFSYILFGGSVQEEDIYGQVVGGFVSNHYGWASAIFLSTSMDVFKNNKSISTIRKGGMVIFALLAFYIMAISGSRSGYLTFVLSFVLFILKTKNTSVALKMLTVILSMYVIISLYGDKDSALNRRLEKTETQLEKGDARSQSRQLGFDTMGENPISIVTGFGFFAFSQAMITLNPKVEKVVGLHNSYLELLFGSGLFIFAFFLFFFVGKTVWYFARYHSAQYIFLPPILLIPFFENNINPGHFLFFPWFAIMFYYIHFNEKQLKIETLAQQMPPVRRHRFL
jgi:O-antigen ligase